MKSLRKMVLLLITLFISITVVMQIFYYSNYSTILEANTNDYLNTVIRNAHNKVNQNLEILSKISTTIEEHESVKLYLDGDRSSFYATDHTIASLMDAYPDFLSNIAILNNAGEILSAYDPEDPHLLKILADYDIAALSYNYSYFTKNYFNGDSDISYFASISPIFSQKGLIPQRTGTTILISNTSEYQRMIDTLDLPPEAFFLISDNEDTIIVSSDPSTIRMKRYEILNETGLVNDDSYGEVLYNGNASRIHSGFLVDPEWRTFAIIPTSAISSDFVQIGVMGSVISLVTAALIVALSLFLLTSITRPISHIASELNNIGQNHTDKRLKIESSNEIGRIAYDINTMLDRISKITQENLETQQELYTAELAQNQAHFIALQSQINPHFLYNTLECMRSIGEYHSIGEISCISTAMANIFRYAIKERSFVRVSDEIKIVQDYFSIINIRFDNRFRLELDLEDSVTEQEIIKMVLQPIVENSVYHGLEPKEGKGVIYITGKMINAKTVRIEIADTGVGVEPYTLELLQTVLKNKISFEQITYSGFEKRSIGLLNINVRMKMNYPDTYQMQISSQEHQGTTVVIQYCPERATK